MRATGDSKAFRFKVLHVALMSEHVSETQRKRGWQVHDYGKYSFNEILIQ